MGMNHPKVETLSIESVLNTVLHGDSREVLRLLPSNVVDAIVTDPP